MWIWQALLRTVVCSGLVFLGLAAGWFPLQLALLLCAGLFLFFLFADPAAIFRRAAVFLIYTGASACLWSGWDVAAKVDTAMQASGPDANWVTTAKISIESEPIWWAGPLLLILGIVLAIVVMSDERRRGQDATPSRWRETRSQPATYKGNGFYKVKIRSRIENSDDVQLHIIKATIEVLRWRDRVLVDRDSIKLKRVELTLRGGTILPVILLSTDEATSKAEPAIPVDAKDFGVVEVKVKFRVRVPHRKLPWILLWPFLLLFDMHRQCLRLWLAESGNDKAMKANLIVDF